MHFNYECDELAGPAFDWVAKELVFPSDDARTTLRSAYMAARNEGVNRGAQRLKIEWQKGTSWPSGEAWLRSQGWSPDIGLPAAHRCSDNDLYHLLFSRLSHVQHRLYRNRQLLQMIDSDRDVLKVVINRDASSYRSVEHCGYGFDLVMSVGEARPMLLSPACMHPACQCTIDPVVS